MAGLHATSGKPVGAILAGSGFGIALVAGVAALFAGLGVRWGWWTTAPDS